MNSEAGYATVTARFTDTNKSGNSPAEIKLAEMLPADEVSDSIESRERGLIAVRTELKLGLMHAAGLGWLPWSIVALLFRFFRLRHL